MRGEAFRPSASLFSTRSAASNGHQTLGGKEHDTGLDNVTHIGVEGAASNDRPHSDWLE
jgi:3-deoxy-D-arabino-heptulosonate 7-phosphate (DAHP) synthase